jgi:hypothetical protein
MPDSSVPPYWLLLQLLRREAPMLWTVGAATLRQLVTPPELLGRVAAVNMAAQGVRALGAALMRLMGRRPA